MINFPVRREYSGYILIAQASGRYVLFSPGKDKAILDVVIEPPQGSPEWKMWDAIHKNPRVLLADLI